jgi:hypothetical protein
MFAVAQSNRNSGNSKFHAKAQSKQQFQREADNNNAFCETFTPREDSLVYGSKIAFRLTSLLGFFAPLREICFLSLLRLGTPSHSCA